MELPGELLEGGMSLKPLVELLGSGRVLDRTDWGHARGREDR